jgi:hypothetical protein
MTQGGRAPAYQAQGPKFKPQYGKTHTLTHPTKEGKRQATV